MLILSCYQNVIFLLMCQNIGEHFYYRGCGWKKKHVEWTEADKEWIYEVNGLLDKMLGPDHFEFVQTPDTKYCIVASHSQQSYECDHKMWEGQPQEQEDSPVKPSLTPEPPRKILKPSSSPPVKRTLNLKTKKARQKSAVVRKFVQLPTQTPICIPRVPGWGGTFGNATLINTCPVDNFLTIVYTRMKDVLQTSANLSLIRESWAEDLVSIEKLFDWKEFLRGKIEWFASFPAVRLQWS